MFCWERCVELKRDALPALEAAGVKLFVVGIGSPESAKEFSERLEFPAARLLVDDSEETEVYRAAGTRNSQRDASTGKQVFEGIGSMWSAATNDAIKQRGRSDLDAVTGKPWAPGPYKPLMPKGKSMMSGVEKTLVQGASFVFDGEATLLEHYDESSGAHVSVRELLDAALAR